MIWLTVLSYAALGLFVFWLITLLLGGDNARRRPPLQGPAAGRGMGHCPADPPRAGRFDEAVKVIVQAANDQRGMHAKQAVDLLRLRGHSEAAELVELRLRYAQGHLSARQAVHFLTAEGAWRASAGSTSQESNA
ncbi:hypothetical protein OHA04_27265 [Streptomyces sp. NBC_01590]|uniref:hypothetical protein n=1 Tax=Streptomyces sp. NBC_01590 TaxID=2975887 RepID=UPI0038672398